MKTYQSKAVANAFLDLAEASGSRITPMQIQKLVYLAHGWGLALIGTPLIDEDVQAWKFGPVIKSLYHEFKSFGNGPITSRANNIEFDPETISIITTYPEIPKSDEEAHALISRVWEVYGEYTGPQLSNITHQKGTPWSQIYKPGLLGITIPNEVIREHYESLAKERSNCN